MKSGIEYVGDIFGSWLWNYCNEKNYELYEYKLQNPTEILLKKLNEFEPDLIVLNEIYERNLQASIQYPAKTLLLNHTSIEKNNCDIEMMLSKDYYMPCYGEYIKPWHKRKKFGFFNFPIEKRFSNSFVNLLNKYKEYYELKIDGYFDIKKLKENGLFDDFKNIFNFMDLFPQERMTEIFNDYKFFIMPRTGGEIFNISMLQAIKCGCIPLVSFEHNSDEIKKWIKRFDGLYCGFSNEEQLLSFMVEYSRSNNEFNENRYYIKFSKEISEKALKKFDNKYIKEVFINNIEKLI